jgi:hypothetical protein
MKISRYAVSVQWGGSFHYFEKYFDTKEEALTYAQAWLPRRHKGQRRGAKPTVHIWYLIDSFKKE